MDDVAAITALLHRAYRPLAERGLRYVATHQDDVTTLKRLTANGREGYLAILDGALVGTIVLIPPGTYENADWYCQPGVAVFGQFAVAPELQRAGIGGKLLNYVENRARQIGAEQLACDTAESAEHLIAYYERRGYVRVGEVQWRDTNYRSVVLSKDVAHRPM